MQNISQKELKFLGFYYFWLIFLVACTAIDFYMDTVTGFTFGYVGAFIYFALRLREVKKESKDWDWGEEDEE
tara:strand:- start:386 stop:601 length:216 start_codon:yes stop_codon:yes gene_type:complete